MLEVVVALGVLPILVLSLFFLFSRSLRLQRQADDLTRASEIARQQMESIRRLPLSQVPAAAVFAGVPADVNHFPPAPYPWLELDGQRYDLRVETASLGSCRAVRVEASWSGGHHVSLETILNP